MKHFHNIVSFLLEGVKEILGSRVHLLRVKTFVIAVITKMQNPLNTRRYSQLDDFMRSFVDLLYPTKHDFEHGRPSPLDDLLRALNQTVLDAGLLEASTSRYGIRVDPERPYEILYARLLSLPSVYRHNVKIPGCRSLEDVVNMGLEEFFFLYPNGDYGDRVFVFAREYL